MIVNVQHITVDKRTGRLSYRRAFPSDVQAKIGKREFHRTLRSKSIAHPVAARLFRDADAEFNKIVSTARQSGVTSGPIPLDKGMLEFLIATYNRRMLENIAQTHFDASDTNVEWAFSPSWRFVPYGFTESNEGTRSSRRRKYIPLAEEHWRSVLADGDRNGIISIEGQNSDDLPGEFSLSVEQESDTYFNLCKGLLIADLEIMEKVKAQLAGQLLIEAPDVPTRPNVRGNQSRTMRDLSNDLLCSPTANIQRTTRSSWLGALRFWEEVHGADKVASDITRRDVTKFIETLTQRPISLTRNEEAFPLPQLVSAYDGRETERLSRNSVVKYLGNLRSIWNRSVRRDDTGLGANPFENHEINVVQNRRETGLTIDELQSILGLPVFTQGERPNRGRGEASYWLPLLLLFTGARPEEVAQLLVADFFRAADGSLRMKITSDGVHPAGGERRLKTEKHGSGEREFPVPQALLELGIGEYLAWLKSNDETALFPKLTFSQHGLYDGFARWWRPYIAQANVIKSGKRAGREFRHSFSTAARESGVTGEHHKYIMGHAIEGVNATYGDLKPLGEAMAKIEFNGLSLTGVKRWSPPGSA